MQTLYMQTEREKRDIPVSLLELMSKYAKEVIPVNEKGIDPGKKHIIYCQHKHIHINKSSGRSNSDNIRL